MITTLSIQADHKWSRNGAAYLSRNVLQEVFFSARQQGGGTCEGELRGREASQDFGIQHEDLMRAEPPFLRICGASRTAISQADIRRGSQERDAPAGFDWSVVRLFIPILKEPAV